MTALTGSDIVSFRTPELTARLQAELSTLISRVGHEAPQFLHALRQSESMVGEVVSRWRRATTLAVDAIGALEEELGRRGDAGRALSSRLTDRDARISSLEDEAARQGVLIQSLCAYGSRLEGAVAQVIAAATDGGAANAPHAATASGLSSSSSNSVAHGLRSAAVSMGLLTSTAAATSATTTITVDTVDRLRSAVKSGTVHAFFDVLDATFPPVPIAATTSSSSSLAARSSGSSGVMNQFKGGTSVDPLSNGGSAPQTARSTSSSRLQSSAAGHLTEQQRLASLLSAHTLTSAAASPHLLRFPGADLDGTLRRALAYANGAPTSTLNDSAHPHQSTSTSNQSRGAPGAHTSAASGNDSAHHRLSSSPFTIGAISTSDTTPGSAPTLSAATTSTSSVAASAAPRAVAAEGHPPPPAVGGPTSTWSDAPPTSTPIRPSVFSLLEIDLDPGLYLQATVGALKAAVALRTGRTPISLAIAGRTLPSDRTSLVDAGVPVCALLECVFKAEEENGGTARTAAGEGGEGGGEGGASSSYAASAASQFQPPQQQQRQPQQHVSHPVTPPPIPTRPLHPPTAKKPLHSPKPHAAPQGLSSEQVEVVPQGLSSSGLSDAQQVEVVPAIAAVPATLDSTEVDLAQYSSPLTSLSSEETAAEDEIVRGTTAAAAQDAEAGAAAASAGNDIAAVSVSPASPSGASAMPASTCPEEKGAAMNMSESTSTSAESLRERSA